MFKQLLIILRKEIKDALRDRKALSTILLVPVINLAVIAGVMLFLVYMQQTSSAFVLPVSGQAQATPMMQWLEERQITLTEAPANAMDQVKNGELEFFLRVPDNFPEQFAKMQDARLELVYDTTRKDVAAKVARVKSAIQEWSSTVGAQRLLLRGVSPRVMTPVQVQDVDVAPAQQGSTVIFGIVALVLTLTLFTTTTGISIDMMAGEREKQSLESLLLSPVSRWAIVAGKWATAVVFTLAVATLVVAALYVLLPQLPLAQLGVRGYLSFTNLLSLLVVAVPLAAVATAFQLFVAIFSKSYKEAQSYIGLLMILPIFVGYYVVWSDVSPPWQYWVPVMGTQMLMEDLLSLGTTAPINILASTFTSFLLAGILALAVVRQLQREKIIYG